MAIKAQRQPVRGAWVQPQGRRAIRRCVRQPFGKWPIIGTLRVAKRSDLLPIVGERLIARARPQRQDIEAALAARLGEQHGMLTRDLRAALCATPGLLWSEDLSKIYTDVLSARVPRIKNGAGPVLDSWLETLPVAGRMLHPNCDARVRALLQSLPPTSPNLEMSQCRKALTELTVLLTKSLAWRVDTAMWLHRITVTITSLP